MVRSEVAVGARVQRKDVVEYVRSIIKWTGALECVEVSGITNEAAAA